MNMKFVLVCSSLCLGLVGISQEKTLMKDHKYKEINISETHHGEISLNFLSVYTKGIHHYNEGVIDIRKYSSKKAVRREDFNDKNKFTQEKFRLALPYLEQAHEIDPHDYNTVAALAGIYFALNDQEKYHQFSNEAKKLK